MCVSNTASQKMYMLSGSQNRCATECSSRRVWLTGAMSKPTNKRKSQGQITQTLHIKRNVCCQPSGLKSCDVGRTLAMHMQRSCGDKVLGLSRSCHSSVDGDARCCCQDVAIKIWFVKAALRKVPCAQQGEQKKFQTT